MPKVMLINVTHSEESRVGILNEGVLEAFEIESLSRAHLKGNIYKGVVHRIHPALEAAFVDIGADRDAFLPLDEICFKNLPERPKANGKSGSSNGGRRQLRIRDVLRPGQDILVQITKEQFANKPPTLSTFYSLPGRNLVLLPGSDDTGISRRIEGEERDRLRKAVDAIKPESGFGLIVRTVAGLEETDKELSRDLDYLMRLWGSVQEASEGQRAPALVYREHDIVQRAIRDFYTPDISEIHIDDEEVYERAREFLAAFMPGNEAVLKLYRGEQPMFSAFNAEEQIESVFGRRVKLRSGGSIVIDGTEALTAIDVNSGGSVRGANPEETAFRTNREAAAEVARQMRLRDIGGIIVVDFIDMRDSKHIREIEQLMRNEMRIDKARHETSRISSLGLMEISRQRLRPAAANTSHAVCPLCEGFGSVRASASAGLAAVRRIHNRISLGDVESMRVTMPSSVGLYVLNQKRDDLAQLEARYRSTIEIRLSDTLLPHEIEIDVKERSRKVTNGKAVEPGSVAEASADNGDDEGGEAARNGENGGSGRKRRRRRRRRGGSKSAEAQNGAASSDDADATKTDETQAKAEVAPAAEAASDGKQETPQEGGSSRRRSRGRRGGRRRSGRSNREQSADTGSKDASPSGATSSPESSKSAAPVEKESTATPPPAGEAKSSPQEQEKPATKKAATRKATTKKTAAKKTTKKAAAKKTTTKKAAAKKTTTKKAAAKKTTTKKTTTKKAAAKKTTSKKTTTKKAAATTEKQADGGADE